MTSGRPILVAKATYYGKYELHGSDDVFSPESAHRQLLQHRKKNEFIRHKIKLKIFSNGIKVAPANVFSEVIKHFYPFSEIQRFYVFRIEPRVLLIGHLGHDLTKHFLIFQFDSEANLNRVCDEIERVKGTDKVLPNGDRRYSVHMIEDHGHGTSTLPLPTPSATPHSTIGHERPRRSPSPLFRAPSPQQVYRAPSPKPVYRVPSPQPVYRTPSPKPVYRAPSPIVVRRRESPPRIYRRESPPIIERRVIPVERNSPPKIRDINQRRYNITYASAPHSPAFGRKHRGSCHKKTPDGRCDEWEASEIYIDFDGKNGPRVSSEGPVYMYSAQQKHSHHHSVAMAISSSSSSSNSGSLRRRGYRKSRSPGAFGRVEAYETATVQQNVYNGSPAAAKRSSYIVNGQDRLRSEYNNVAGSSSSLRQNGYSEVIDYYPEGRVSPRITSYNSREGNKYGLTGF